MPFVLHRKLPQALSLIHHMGHQATISFYEDISRLQVSLGRERQIKAFFFLRQRFWEAAESKLEGVKQTAKQQPNTCVHCLHLSTTLFPISPGYSDGTG